MLIRDINTAIIDISHDVNPRYDFEICVEIIRYTISWFIIITTSSIMIVVTVVGLKF